MCWPRCATPGLVGAGAELVLSSETSPMTAPARAPAHVAATSGRPSGRRRGAGRAGTEVVVMDAQGLVSGSRCDRIPGHSTVAQQSGGDAGAVQEKLVRALAGAAQEGVDDRRGELGPAPREEVLERLLGSQAPAVRAIR